MKIINEKVKTSDNFELDVEIRIPDGKIKKTVVMSHGLTSYKEGRKNQLLQIANALCNDGFKVIQYDFRGHGKSSGTDLDVCPTSLKDDLDTIINNYIKDDGYYLFGFSFGGFATCEYLFYTNNKSVKKVVLIGPPLDPINSSLLNPKEFCQPEIQEAIDSGSLDKNGYAYWSSKNFRVSKRFLNECYEFDYKSAMKSLSGRTLLLQGKNDKNVDKDYNEKYSKEYDFKYIEFDASHSLWEKIDDAINEIIKYYNN